MIKRSITRPYLLTKAEIDREDQLIARLGRDGFLSGPGLLESDQRTQRFIHSRGIWKHRAYVFIEFDRKRSSRDSLVILATNAV